MKCGVNKKNNNNNNNKKAKQNSHLLSHFFSLTYMCLLTYLKLTSVLFTIRHASVNSSCAQLHRPPPPGYCAALARLFSPGVGHLQILRCPGAGHLPTPGAIPQLLTCTRFPVRLLLHRRYYWKKRTLAHLSRRGGCKGMFSISCMHFFIAYH